MTAKWFRRVTTGLAIVGGLGCFTCIARGARIRTPSGLRPIEEIREGDEVFCVEPETRMLVATRVIARRSAQRECVKLSCDETSIVLTSDHPVFCPDTKEWAPAGDWALRKRTRLLFAGDERVREIEVRQVSTFAGIHEVFDLTVEHALHNFIADGVLVHNKSPPPSTCLLPDGGVTSEYDFCACVQGGTGRVRCEGADFNTAVCVECPEPIAANDAGVVDGGNSDGGSGGDAGP